MQMLQNTEIANVRENGWLRSLLICPGERRGDFNLIFWKVFTRILTVEKFVGDISPRL